MPKTKTTLSRRALLGAFASLSFFAFTRSARADLPRSRIVKTASDERGVTLTLELEHAPFPAAGFAYQDPTVIVFVPRHHRPARDGAVSMVVHFHGHNSTAERAMIAHQLREQIFDSKQNAILVVPEIATLAPDSAAGKLEQQGAFARLVDDVLRTLDSHEGRAALGRSWGAQRIVPGKKKTRGSIIELPPSPGRICVSAHSGGYHAAACALKHGGARIHEVYLFDALYADVDVFKDWVIAGSGRPMGSRHKLVSYFTAGTTEWNTKKLFAELAQAGVACVHETVEGTLSRAELTHAEAVSIRTQNTHGTVTSETNGLRDCLYASALHRNLRSSWHDVKHGARPLERRR